MSLQSNTYFFFNRGLLNPQGCSNIAAHMCKAVKDTAVDTTVFRRVFTLMPSSLPLR